MFNFDKFFKELKDGVKDMAKREAKDFVKEATADSKEFLDTVKDDLKTWSEQLARGELTKDEFEFLLGGKKDLAKMEALKQAGLAAVKVDRVRTALLDLVISAATKSV